MATRPALLGRLSPGMRRMVTSPASWVVLALLVWLGWRNLGALLRWAVLDADWTGSRAEDCTGAGACWVFIRVHLNRFLFGDYPPDQQWRVILAFGLPMLLSGAVVIWKALPHRQKIGAALVLLGPAFALALLHGGFLGLPFVPTGRWGGLMVTLVVGGLGILLSLPLGILLALGRRSGMPFVRIASIVYIEVWRGVPLLGVLFMATFLLPLLLPAGTAVPQFYAVMAGIILYAAAYLAEVVRGGLLSIAPTQFEASDALGFSFWGKMRVVVLPQALHNVLPALISIFISLFKSSTLVMVVGVFDLLGTVQNSAQNPAWAGHFAEGYVFAGLVFWVICYAVSSWGEALARSRRKRSRNA